jgi:hypothetical protein
MQKFFFFLIACFIATQSSAQLRAGVFAGISNYQGDLVDQVFQKPGAAFGLSLSYAVSGRLNLRGGLTFAKVSGADSLNSSASLRRRNLSFKSPVTELSFVGEFNTMDMDYRSWSPYLFAGLAVYHFNPYSFDANGNKVFLQPLSTEGQGLPGNPGTQPYSRLQLAIPFGGGIKYNINDNIRIALEIGMRKLFTDYLDDVSSNYADPAELLAEKGPLALELSYRGDDLPGGDPAYPSKGEQRGSPKYNDYYYFTGIHLSFLLPEGRGGSRAARKSGYGCPTVF